MRLFEVAQTVADFLKDEDTVLNYTLELLKKVN